LCIAIGRCHNKRSHAGFQAKLFDNLIHTHRYFPLLESAKRFEPRKLPSVREDNAPPRFYQGTGVS
jgi:hypothetical protein